MKTFNIFRNWSASTTPYQRLRSTDGVELLDTVNAYSAVRALHDVFGKFYNDQYFPNDEQTEIKDCDGEVVWEEGDEMIDMRDFTLTVEEVKD